MARISEIAKLPQPYIEKLIVERKGDLSLSDILKLGETFPIEVIEVSKFMKKKIDGNSHDEKL